MKCPTDLTWEEKNPASYRFNTKSLGKLKATLKREEEKMSEEKYDDEDQIVKTPFGKILPINITYDMLNDMMGDSYLAASIRTLAENQLVIAKMLMAAHPDWQDMV